MPVFTALPPLALYIHIPWCERKCPYCDFNSHTIRDQIPYQKYIEALIADLEQELPLVWGRRISSIFFGGGTPSLFPPQQIEQLLSEIRARIPLTSNVEITLEANPGTVDNQHITGFKAAGINRISFGVQSFNDDILNRLGRIHNSQQAVQAIEAAQQCGFDKINLDLMFALPGQSLALARQDMQTALDLDPGHISFYHLTIEPNTAFYKQPPILPTEDLAWDIQALGQDMLTNYGYEQYEISAYAKTGQSCKHNQNYWLFGDYIGIGAGAHGKISRADTQTIQRRWKLKHPQDYLLKTQTNEALSGEQILTQSEITSEFLMNALRLQQGFSTETFTKHTGLSETILLEKLKPAQQKELIGINTQTHHIEPTETGKRFLNELLIMIMD